MSPWTPHVSSLHLGFLIQRSLNFPGSENTIWSRDAIISLGNIDIFRECSTCRMRQVNLSQMMCDPQLKAPCHFWEVFTKEQYFNVRSLECRFSLLVSRAEAWFETKKMEWQRLLVNSWHGIGVGHWLGGGAAPMGHWLGGRPRSCVSETVEKAHLESVEWISDLKLKIQINPTSSQLTQCGSTSLA